MYKKKRRVKKGDNEDKEDSYGNDGHFAVAPLTTLSSSSSSSASPTKKADIKEDVQEDATHAMKKCIAQAKESLFLSLSFSEISNQICKML